MSYGYDEMEAKAAEVSAMQSAMNALTNGRELVAMMAEKLVMQLAPVLLPRNETVPRVGLDAVQPPCAPLFGDIEFAAAELNAVAERLADALERLAL